MANGDGLTCQFVDEGWKIYSFRQDHGDIVLKHLTEMPCRFEERLACAWVRMVLVEFTKKREKQYRLLTFRSHEGSQSSRSLKSKVRGHVDDTTFIQEAIRQFQKIPWFIYYSWGIIYTDYNPSKSSFKLTALEQSLGWWTNKCS